MMIYVDQGIIRDENHGKNGFPFPIDSYIGIQASRHSTAHLLAHAIKRLYPDAQFGIGPVTNTGFFYDVLTSTDLSNSLGNIQETMIQIIDEKIPIIYSLIDKSQASELFKHDQLKLKILSQIPQEQVSIYQQKDFVDLCKGPHLSNTGLIPRFIKLTNVERMDNNIQRVYGEAYTNETSFHHAPEDHRDILTKMDLASFHPYSPGMVFWKQNGILILEKLYELIRKYTNNFTEVITPPIGSNELWKATGHLAEYHENMFIIEDRALKPMSCPMHTLVFKENMRSYKDLPYRISEFGRVFRQEYTGGLIGLKRLQHFTQDDGHIFCTHEQMLDEIVDFIKKTIQIYESLGLNRDKNFPDFIFQVSTSDNHQDSNDILKKALETLNIIYTVNENDAAFYGPKIEIHIRDSGNRYWQCGTIQVDKSLSIKLDASYIDSFNNTQRPVVLHRAHLGSLERFLGIFIETYPIPFRMQPIQMVLLSVNSTHGEYIDTLTQKINQNYTYRYKTDLTNQSISKKILHWSSKRVPYIIVIGDKEIAINIFTVRVNNTTFSCTLEELQNLYQKLN